MQCFTHIWQQRYLLFSNLRSGLLFRSFNNDGTPGRDLNNDGPGHFYLHSAPCKTYFRGDNTDMSEHKLLLIIMQ